MTPNPRGFIKIAEPMSGSTGFPALNREIADHMSVSISQRTYGTLFGVDALNLIVLWLSSVLL
jgi:hypothetical protein